MVLVYNESIHTEVSWAAHLSAGKRVSINYRYFLLNYTVCFKKNTANSSRDMSKNNRKLQVGQMWCLYRQILFHGLRVLNVAANRQHRRYQADMRIHL